MSYDFKSFVAEDDKRKKELQAPLSEDPYEGEQVPLSAGQMAGSAGVEIGGSLTGELATTMMLSKNPKLKAVGAGIRFGSGFLSSLVAQKAVEGKEEIELGRALAAGSVNTMFTTRKFSTRPLLDFTKQGAAMGVTETVVSDLIDEGKIDLKDAAISGGIGGTLGLGFGKIDEKFGNITKRLTGKDAAEIDSMIRSGELSDSYLKEVMQPIAGREIKGDELQRARLKIEREHMAREQIQRDAPFMDRFLEFRNFIVPSKAIGKNAREDYFEFANQLQRAESLSTRLKKNIDNLSSTKPELRQDIIDYMDGKAMSKALEAEGISGDLRAMREVEIETMQGLKDTIENSDTLRFLPKEAQDKVLGRLQESINKGAHVYDSDVYRAFTDQKFAQSEIKEQDVIEEVLETLKRDADPEELADEKAVAKLRKKAEDHLDHIKSMRASHKRKKGKELLSSLPGRFEMILDGHMPGPKERKFLGEEVSKILTPGQRARFRIRDAIRHKAYIDSDKAVIKSLKDTAQIRYTKEPGFIELRLKSTSGEDLDGRQMYIPINTADAIVKLYELGYREDAADSAAGLLRDVYQSGVGLSKAVKVVINPPSYIVNAVGGVMSAASNGVLPSWKNIKEYGKGAALAGTEFHGLYNYVTRKTNAKIGDASVRQSVIRDVNEMYKYGLGNATIAANEVAAAMNDGKVSGFLRKGTDAFGKLYSISDTATRFTIWKKNVQDMKQILKANGVKVSDDQIKKIAAEITNDTYQNYERTSRLGKYLSRIGVMPPFVTFSLEMARNTTNQVLVINRMLSKNGDMFAQKYGVELTDSARAALAKEGRKRAGFLSGVFAATAAAPFVMGEIAERIGGEKVGDRVDPDREEDFRFFLPSYARDKQFYATFDEKSKKGTFAMTSYLFPHAVITEKLAAALSQAGSITDEEPVVRDVLRAMFTEFVGEGTFVNQSLFRAIDNRDFRGNKISEAEGAKLLQDKLIFFGKETFEPGAIREFNKLIDSLKGQGDFSTKEVLLRQVGLRFQKVDIPEMAKFRIQDFSDRYSAARGKYTGAVKHKDARGDEQVRLYREAVEEARVAFDRVQESYDRLDGFGFSKEEKIKILREGNVKSSDIFRIVRGMPFKEFPMEIKLSTGEQYSELFMNMSRSDINREIKQMLRGSPEERLQARKFREEQRRRYNDERRARNEEDKLLMNMSVRERADILKELGVQIDKSLMKEYKRKGVISKDVSTLLK